MPTWFKVLHVVDLVCCVDKEKKQKKRKKESSSKNISRILRMSQERLEESERGARCQSRWTFPLLPPPIERSQLWDKTWISQHVECELSRKIVLKSSRVLLVGGRRSRAKKQCEWHSTSLWWSFHCCVLFLALWKLTRCVLGGVFYFPTAHTHIERVSELIEHFQAPFKWRRRMRILRLAA